MEKVDWFGISVGLFCGFQVGAVACFGMGIEAGRAGSIGQDYCFAIAWRYAALALPFFVSTVYLRSKLGGMAVNK